MWNTNLRYEDGKGSIAFIYTSSAEGHCVSPQALSQCQRGDFAQTGPRPPSPSPSGPRTLPAHESPALPASTLPAFPSFSCWPLGSALPGIPSMLRAVWTQLTSHWPWPHSLWVWQAGEARDSLAVPKCSPVGAISCSVVHHGRLVLRGPVPGRNSITVC